MAESYGISEVGGIADDGKLLEGVEVKLEAWGEFSPDDAPHVPESVIAQITVASSVVGSDENGAVMLDWHPWGFPIQHRWDEAS